MNPPALLQGWPCPTLCLDARGLVVSASDGLCRLLDQDRETIENRPFDGLLTAASRVLFQSYLHPLLQLHGNVEEISLAMRARQGAPVDVLFYSARVPPPAGAPDSASTAHQVHVMLAPIRRRRGIEDEMLRVKRAADLAPGMIFQLMQLQDGRRHFPFVSEATRRLYETTPEAAQASADAVFDRVHVDDRPALLAALNTAADLGQDWTGSYRVRLDDAELRWHELHCTPRELAGGVRVWHGHIADVTQRRAMEAALAERAAADRMAQVRSDFLARVSHELRTPLNGIIGFTQLLASDGADNLTAGQRERLAVVAASGQHLLQLVDQVLDITSAESMKAHLDLGPVGLARCMNEALALVSNQAAAAGIALDAPFVADGLTVVANALRLRQVLVNLLSNAIKYNKPRGSVQVQVQVQVDTASVRLVVNDQGIGMTPQQLAELFQPFNRLGAQFTNIEGSGLGLVITRHLLLQMNSSLSVDSQAGVGSAFAFELPLHVGVGSPVPQPPNPATAVQTVKPAEPDGALLSQPEGIHSSVLYVEDNPVNAMLMEAIIGLRPGVALKIAPTGTEALQVLDGWVPDLLLLDMHLPDMLGSALLAEIRRRFPERATLAAVAVSAAARSEDVVQAMADGFADYWTKPLDIDRTLTELDRWLSL